LYNLYAAASGNLNARAPRVAAAATPAWRAPPPPASAQEASIAVRVGAGVGIAAAHCLGIAAIACVMYLRGAVAAGGRGAAASTKVLVQDQPAGEAAPSDGA
jgi:hypothetical protein